MRLTKNEKKVLSILLDNSRTTDSDIGHKLNISSQAVGKIRKKLEASVIKSYSLDLDYSKLGIYTFAIAIAKLTSDGLNLGELEVEGKLQNSSSIIHVYRLPKGSSTHVVIYGFMDINEMDDYFHSVNMKNELHKYLEIQDLFTFSHNSLIKSSPTQLFNRVIDNIGTESSKVMFDEIEKFKRKL